MVQIAALLWVALDEKEEEGNEIASAGQLSEKGNKKQTDVQQQKNLKWVSIQSQTAQWSIITANPKLASKTSST